MRGFVVGILLFTLTSNCWAGVWSKPRDSFLIGLLFTAAGYFTGEQARRISNDNDDVIRSAQQATFNSQTWAIEAGSYLELWYLTLDPRYFDIYLTKHQQSANWRHTAEGYYYTASQNASKANNYSNVSAVSYTAGGLLIVNAIVRWSVPDKPKKDLSLDYRVTPTYSGITVSKKF